MKPHEQVVKLLELMREAAKRSQPHKVEEISDQIETLTAAYMEPPVIRNPLAGVHLTGNEMALLEFLITRGERGASRNGCLDIMERRNPGSEALQKTVDVYVCKLRAKLIQANSPYSIETIRGRGYRLVNKSDHSKDMKAA